MILTWCRSRHWRQVTAPTLSSAMRAESEACFAILRIGHEVRSREHSAIRDELIEQTMLLVHAG
jgi:hypothetical protein